MKLADRLSLFFLAALAVVLVGFSVALDLLAAGHLEAQADERLAGAMRAVTAAVEVHPDEVEWEPLERRTTLGEALAADQVRWTLHDPGGCLVDCSANVSGEGADRRDWRVLARQVRPGSFEALPVDGHVSPFRGGLNDGFPSGQAPGAVTLPADRTYHGPGLVITVAVSEQPNEATLGWLAGTLAGVSLLTWLTAAVLGRWLCRQALRPVTRMAASAREIRAEPKSPRSLDVAPTGDELEDLGRAFNELLADLREALARQERFTGDASHQLRTPLTALLGHVDVALRKARSPDEYRQALAVVHERGAQLRRIMESLLFIARADADTPLPDLEVIDLAAWADDALAGWTEHPRAADIRGPERSGPAVLARTHRGLLGQVLDNLLDNACKYSEAGRPITVKVEARGNEAMLTVADEGPGMDAEELAKVFEPFYRSARARWNGTPGVGLGLTVARRVVDALGGRLEVESEPGRGSRFAVILLVAGLAPAEASPAAHQATPQ